METRTTVEIKSDTKSLRFGYWDMEGAQFIPIAGMSDEERNQAAELLRCSPVLLDALTLFAETIAMKVGRDLRDIWKRLDAAGIE